MSIIDSRTKCATGIYRTPTSLNLIVLSYGSAKREQLNSLKQYNIQKQIDLISQSDLTGEIYKYKGKLPSYLENIQQLPMQINPRSITTRNIRDYDSVKSIIKTLFPTGNINLYSLYGDKITYDRPYIYFNGHILCHFTPKFEDYISPQAITQIDNCMVYIIEKPVYLLQNDAQRHIASKLGERLIINLATGRVTLEYKDVIGEKYCEYMFEFDTKSFSWQKIHMRSMGIDGYKAA